MKVSLRLLVVLALVLLFSFSSVTPALATDESDAETSPNPAFLPLFDSRVVGGVDVTDATRHPYTVVITFSETTTGSGYSVCTGSLISNSWVMTAAHCADGLARGFVRAGSTRHVNTLDCTVSNTTGGTCVRVASSYIHPSYFSSTTGTHDVALFKLQSAIPYSSTVAQMCLNNVRYNAANNNNVQPSVWYVGYGVTSGGDSGTFPNYLRETITPLPTNPTCTVDDVCTTRITPATDSCFGDSGGGVLHWQNRGIAVSVVSRGPDDCLGGGTDAEVQPHLGWILGVVDEPLKVGKFTSPSTACVTAQTVSTNKTSFTTSESVIVSYTNMPKTFTLTVIGSSVAAKTITTTANTAQNGSTTYTPFSVTVTTTFTLQARSSSNVVLASSTFTVTAGTTTTRTLTVDSAEFSRFQPVTGKFTNMPTSFSISVNGAAGTSFTGGASGSFSLPAQSTGNGLITLTARDTSNNTLATATTTIRPPTITPSKSVFSMLEAVTGSVAFMPANGCKITLPLANSGSSSVTVTSSTASFSLPAPGASAPTTAVALTAADSTTNTVLATSSTISFTSFSLVINGGAVPLFAGDVAVTGSFSAMPTSFQMQLDGKAVGSPLTGPSGTFSLPAPFAGGAHVVRCVTADANASELASAGFSTFATVRLSKSVFSTFEPLTGTFVGAPGGRSVRLQVQSASTNAVTMTTAIDGQGSFTLQPATAAAGASVSVVVEMIDASTSLLLEVSAAAVVVGPQITVDKTSYLLLESVAGSFQNMPSNVVIHIVSTAAPTTVVATATLVTAARYSFAASSLVAGTYSVRAVNPSASNAIIASISVTVTAPTASTISLSLSGQFVSADNIKGTVTGLPAVGDALVYIAVGPIVSHAAVKSTANAFTLAPAYAVGTVPVKLVRNGSVVATATATLSASVLGSSTNPVPSAMVAGRSYIIGYSKFPSSLATGRAIRIGVVNSSNVVLSSVAVSAASGTVTLVAPSAAMTGIRVVGYDERTIIFVQSSLINVTLAAVPGPAPTPDVQPLSVDDASVGTVLQFPPLFLDDASVLPAAVEDAAELEQQE